MSKVRLISQGSAKDYEGLSDFVKRGCAFVEENEPGALAYECFADEASGRVLWHEMYEDEDAFVAHVQNLTKSGMLDEMMQVYEIERITFLTRITDPRIQEIAQQFGAAPLHGIGGVVR